AAQLMTTEGVKSWNIRRAAAASVMSRGAYPHEQPCNRGAGSRAVASTSYSGYLLIRRTSSCPSRPFAPVMRTLLYNIQMLQSYFFSHRSEEHTSELQSR